MARDPKRTAAGAPRGAPLRSQGEAGARRARPAASPRRREPRKLPRFSALRSPFSGAGDDAQTPGACAPQHHSGAPITDSRSINGPAPQRARLSDIVVATMGTIAKQMLAHVQGPAPPRTRVRAAQIASMQADVRARFSEPRNVPAHMRMLCDLLQLRRVCTLARCRKSQCCRGCGRCLDKIDVPEPVLRHAVFLMMAARLPWITSGRANERVAYEAWCAAMKARSPSARPRERWGNRPAACG